MKNVMHKMMWIYIGFLCLVLVGVAVVHASASLWKTTAMAPSVQK